MACLGDGFLDPRGLEAAVGFQGALGSWGGGDVHHEQETFRVREQTGDGRENTCLKGSIEQRSARQRLLGHPETTRSSLSATLPTTGLCFYFSRVGLFEGGWERRTVETGHLQSRLEASVGKDSLLLLRPLLQLWQLLEVS